jgi:hypothetical protein
MATLTLEQIEFLKNQKISESMIFDASGLSANGRKEAMELLEKDFYFGGAQCAKGGHTLRTKAGHCIQCSTAKIAYQLRSRAAGYIYLAISSSTSLVKVGFSTLHPQDRGAFLRREAYGNLKDWDVKCVYHAERNAGQKEFAVHSALASFQKPIRYQKTPDNFVECREIFAVDLAQALGIFDRAMLET